MSTSVSGPTTGPGAGDGPGPTRAERLDALPYTREHHRLLVGSGIGWALDAMDVGLIGFVMAALKVHWDLDPGTLGLIGSVGFLGMALGATVGGLLADRFGRRQVFAATLLIYGLATGAAALSAGVGMLMALRFLVGLGLGAELPVASTLVSEFAPTRIRGRVIVFLESFWAVGWLLAALIGYFVIGPYDDGWRWALALGAVPAAYALYVRHRLPESVRYLETQGRDAEAEAAVRAFETSAPMFPGRAVTDAAAVREPEPIPTSELGTGVRALFHPTLRRRTIGLWGVWFLLNFAYYGAFTWLPSLLVADGYTLTQSFGYTLVITIAQLPGYAVSAWLIERWGRKPTLATFLAGAAAGAGCYALADTPATIVAAGCVLSFFCLGAWGALYAVSPETYPTAIRGTGSGWSAGFGRLASIAAPMATTALVSAGGQGAAFAVFAGAFVAAAGFAMLLVEQRGRRLDG